ncbi:hypothetical protein E2C01_094679 [Portunus trituberculatus]|uniref:Uncharacterized protein n=1 Tax=Portunus trituberculatus TaxID=210409 RepID=A0A5B7JXI4_PORTR|nr:hypothetical protein [Portunus trituberculatus]
MEEAIAKVPCQRAKRSRGRSLAHRSDEDTPCLTISDEGVAKGGGKKGGERADSQTPTRASRESPTGSRRVLGFADGLETGALWVRAAD